MSDVKIKFDWGDDSVDQPMPQAFKEKEVAKAGCHTPRVYRFKDIYEGKRKQQLSKCLEAERKQREFHSRPVPTFPRSTSARRPSPSSTVSPSQSPQRAQEL
ncbi:uncharacterized protein LOC117194428 isoform X3 [Drosophila miranda]|uniref:uncharacterized protein LOC117194428 isoform X3 n=1 Tax=Drosophila miranda TaxID=7229 RepID=UPI00143FA787|nr:uncharacterized protein LOC117194428 isoform X3 [Drosophila miranda]